MNPIQISIGGQSNVVGLSIEIGPFVGWGVMALNLALELARQPGRNLAPLVPFRLEVFANPMHRHQLALALSTYKALQKTLDKYPGQALQLQGAVLHGLDGFAAPGAVPGYGIQLFSNMAHIRGRPTLAITFQENTLLAPAAFEHTRAFDRILTGATWNARMLQGHGLTQAMPWFQGIDPTLFHPAPRAGLFRGRFVIFSGGKLEYRKGQDQVLAAFKVFHARHPDAFLLTAWQNYIPAFMAGLENTGHVQGLPEHEAHSLNLRPWLVRNGIAAQDCFDIGRVPNHVMPQILREADVAVFCSRAEGGTNLVAMECMACGLPTILSGNTGHLDLGGEDHCYLLRTQGPVKPTEKYPGVDGWGETSVEEIVEALEAVYADRAEATRRGQAAAVFMQDWTWEKQVQRLLAEIDAFNP